MKTQCEVRKTFQKPSFKSLNNSILPFSVLCAEGRGRQKDETCFPLDFVHFMRNFFPSSLNWHNWQTVSMTFCASVSWCFQFSTLIDKCPLFSRLSDRNKWSLAYWHFPNQCFSPIWNYFSISSSVRFKKRQAAVSKQFFTPRKDRIYTEIFLTMLLASLFRCTWYHPWILAKVL